MPFAKNVIVGSLAGVAMIATSAAALPPPAQVSVTVVRAPGAPEPDWVGWLLEGMAYRGAYGGAHEITTVPADAALTRCTAARDGDRRIACIRALRRDAVTILVHRGAAGSLMVRCIGSGSVETDIQRQAIGLEYLSWGPGPGAEDTGGFRNDRFEMSACLAAAQAEPVQ